jgi:hypothetical protein
MLIRHVLTDKRLLLALPVAIALRYVLQLALVGTVSASVEEPGIHRTTPELGVQGGGDAVLLERRIKKINLDGSEAIDPMSPLAAAAAFGGAILLVGGVLTILTWRQSGTRDDGANDPDREPVVRNAASRGSR